MQGINSLLNSPPQPQISLQDLHSQIQNQPPMHFDSSSSAAAGGGPHDDFLQQMLSATPSWSPNDENHSNAPFHFDESAALASKLRHHQISSPSAAKLLLHHQFLTSRSAADFDTSSFKSPNQGGVGVGDGALFNGFTGSLQTPNHPQQHFHHPQGGSVQNYAPPGPAAANQNPQASGSTGGAPAQPRQRVRARRGQATDPHSIAERLRRERIAERMKALQELVPNANKTDKASMLDEIIDYVKFLQLQVKVLSMSRLGGAGAVAPLLADISAQARGGGGGGAAGGGDSCVQTAEAAEDDGLTVTESQVAKLMEEDMGSAMQYLQGKGLCLMPISLATAISTRNNPMNFVNNPGPPSPSISALTVQSAAVAASDGNVKDATSVSKP